MTSRIPALLQPYVRLPPEASFVLLTGVLGATTNWLTIKFLYAALGALRSAGYGPSQAAKNEVTGDVGYGTETASAGIDGRDKHAEVAVVLVSWLRDWEFWRTEGRRAGGLDLARLAQKGNLVFVDGLTGMLPPSATPSSALSPPRPESSTAAVLPQRGSPILRTNALTLSTRSPQPPTLGPAQPSEPGQKGRYYLTSFDIEHTKEVLKTAISALHRSCPSKPPKIVLILDSPDVLLALSPLTDCLISQALLSAILSLRDSVYSTIITVSVDSPLIHNASHYGTVGATAAPTPLEVNHAAFVIGLAHQAAYTMSVRLLDTGVARDVSGVLRVTVGDEMDWEREGKGDGEKAGLVAREVLYFVGGDGGVKVFERGA